MAVLRSRKESSEKVWQTGEEGEREAATKEHFFFDSPDSLSTELLYKYNSQLPVVGGPASPSQSASGESDLRNIFSETALDTLGYFPGGRHKSTDVASVHATAIAAAVPRSPRLQQVDVLPPRRTAGTVIDVV